MKKTLLALIALSAFAAACHERKAEPRPNYEGSHSASDRAHDSLDKEAKGVE
jgi:nitrous oxide reductase accessory protein NosL